MIGFKISDQEVKETIFKDEKGGLCESNQILGSVHVGRSKLDEGPRFDFQLDPRFSTGLLALSPKFIEY